MLIDKLQIEIHEARHQRGHRLVDTVIMHPETFDDIFKALAINGMGGVAASAPQGVYLSGCRVYRSEDVPKNEFVIR